MTKASTAKNPKVTKQKAKSAQKTISQTEYDELLAARANLIQLRVTLKRMSDVALEAMKLIPAEKKTGPDEVSKTQN